MLVHTRTARQAAEKYPWAAIIVKVRNGYRVFDYPEDYLMWKASNQ